ncbi:RodZ domain-containing protein [Thalassomonas sp. M1454]|uniref:RodZ domain-containing protein n=1 Tax=Thalassomonas sp. M1454 TaxID=2594477 RepID=UPI0011812308|nr:RodZ domain-containing protein [Thalassomonas sp. M1454]TRX53975.1 DUF4115 domain-containing protein [Thalassomonas sp. M1454]
MSNTQQPIDIENDEVLIGPGQILRDARNQQGLTEQQVAEHLNLRPMLVAQIEKNEFDSTTPEIFVRGYLKNFARFVGANESEVLASYASLTIARHKGTQMQSFSRVTRQKAENNRLMMIIYFIIFVLVALTVMWWMQDANNKTSEQGVAEQSVVDDVNQTNTAVTSDDSESAVDSAADSTVDTTIETNETIEAETVSEEKATNDTANAITQTVISSNAPALIPQEQSLAEITTLPTNIDGTEHENITPLETFVFNFVGDCWVNIFDANGDRLAWGIKRADYKMTLTGKAPFTITLGKPELVSIEYNKETVDLSQYLPGQIAKFVWPKA